MDRVPSQRALTSALSRVLRGLLTVETRPHFGAISHAPRVMYPRNTPTRRSYFACPEGRVLSRCTLSSKLFRMLRRSRTLSSFLHFAASLHASRLAYPQSVLSRWSYFACSEGRVPAICTLTLKLCRMIHGSRALNLHSHFGAISHAPRVAYPQFVPSL